MIKVVAVGLIFTTLAASALEAQTPATVLGDPKGGQTPAIENRSGVQTQKFSDGSEVSSDFSGKQAVLCMWGLDVAMLALGRQCADTSDKEFQAELENSISKINRFIVINSLRRPVTQSQIEARESVELAKYQAPGICRADLVAMYRAMKDRGPIALRASTTDMLSIPREPVINPCF